MAGRDVIEVLTHDHREVEQLFTELEPMIGTGAAQAGEERTEKVIVELVRHSVAEEEYLYPLVRDALSGGNELADREIAEHSQAEQIMKRLEQLSPDNVEFGTELRALMDVVRRHVAEEEGELFPQLRQACTTEQLHDLGEKVEEAKKTAPTRPHPSSPSTPPANKLLGPGVAIVDRIRDLLSGRSKHH
jgi:hemerythrin superfamily protein